MTRPALIYRPHNRDCQSSSRAASYNQRFHHLSSKSNAAASFILFCAAFLVSFNCFAYDTNRLDSALGGRESIAIIANADSVRAWRTLGSLEMEQYEHRKRASPGDLGDYYLQSGKAILVPANLASKLSQLMLNKNYGLRNGSAKQCDPEPGVIVSFSRGRQEVDVFFCFECKILLVKPVNQTIRIDHDFDAERSAFLAVIRQIFPNDHRIQSLKN